MELSEKWIERFLLEAKSKASWSKDPSTKVGSIAVGIDNQIIASGYNGFPRNIADTDTRYNDRELKYQYMVHSEMNLIYNSCLTGISLKNAKLFIYGLPPCSECAKGIIQVGISDVYYSIPNQIPDRWKDSINQSISILLEAGLKYHARNY